MVQTEELSISIEGWNGVASGGRGVASRGSEKRFNSSADLESLKSPEQLCEKSKEVTSAGKGDERRGGGNGGGLEVVNWAGAPAGRAFSWEPYLRSNTYKGKFIMSFLGAMHRYFSLIANTNPNQPLLLAEKGSDYILRKRIRARPTVEEAKRAETPQSAQ